MRGRRGGLSSLLFFSLYLSLYLLLVLLLVLSLRTSLLFVLLPSLIPGPSIGLGILLLFGAQQPSSKGFGRAHRWQT